MVNVFLKMRHKSPALPYYRSRITGDHQSTLCCFCGLFFDDNALLQLHVKAKHQLPMEANDALQSATIFKDDMDIEKPHLFRTLPSPSASSAPPSFDFDEAEAEEIEQKKSPAPPPPPPTPPQQATANNALNYVTPQHVRYPSAPAFMAPFRNFICTDCGVFFPDINDLTKHFIERHYVAKCSSPVESPNGVRVLTPDTTNDGGNLLQVNSPPDSTVDLLPLNPGEVKSAKFGVKFEALNHQASTSSPNAAGKYPCGRCGFVCLNREDLEIHSSAHSFTELRYLCPICKKRFRGKRTLEDHYRIHTGEKPYKCPICPATFCQTSNRDRHLNTHRVNYRPFVCDICKRGFTRRLTLVSHYHVHAKTYPFKCNRCGRYFALIEELQKHAEASACFK